MKTHFFLLSLIVLLGVLCSCKKEIKLPNTPTILAGKFVDDFGKPVDSLTIVLSGDKNVSISKRQSVFETQSTTNKDGEYELKAIVPDGTDFLTISFVHKRTFARYLIEVDGTFQEFGDGSSPAHNPLYFKLGKRNILNFKQIQ